MEYTGSRAFGILKEILNNMSVEYGTLGLVIEDTAMEKTGERELKKMLSRCGASRQSYRIPVIGTITSVCSVSSVKIEELYVVTVTREKAVFFMPQRSIIPSEEDIINRNRAKAGISLVLGLNVIDESEQVDYKKDLDVESNCLCLIHKYLLVRTKEGDFGTLN